MKTIFLMIMSVTLFTSVTWSEQAYALCAAEVDYDAKMKASELIFTGTVTRLDNYDGPQIVTFLIHDVIKGQVDTPKHVFQNVGKIFHANDSFTLSSIDVDYKVGKTYKVYVENGETSECTTKLTTPPAGYMWEPGPEDGNYYSDGHEEPLQQYQDANEIKSYRDALSSGSVVLSGESPKLTDRELDDIMDGLFGHGLDHTELPIASIAIDYEKDVLVLWTPDLTIGNKVQELIGGVPFVLLYEEAPVRWKYDGPPPGLEPEPVPNEKFPPGAIVDCIGGLHFNGTTCVSDDVLEISYGHQWLLKIILIITVLTVTIVGIIIGVKVWRKRK